MGSDPISALRIAAVRTRAFRWPIAGTGAAGGRTERSSIVVELTTDEGHSGLGEAAPLEMGSDPISAAAADFSEVAARAPFSIEPTFTAIARYAAEVATSPSARFAIETALANALAASRSCTLADVLADARSASRGSALADVRADAFADEIRSSAHEAGVLPNQHVNVVAGSTRLGAHADVVADGARAPARELACAVVVDTPDQARDAVTAGARTLKIKVGPDGDIERVLAIAAAAPGVALRLDANRTWPRARVHERLLALAELPIEFVEEPCPDAHALLAEPLPCAIALDESLGALSPAALATALASRDLGALVLKPTLLGGLAACMALATTARAAGRDVVVTHALEGPIGTAACAELALALGGLAAGLAPHPALVGWSVQPPQLRPTSIVRAPWSPTLDDLALHAEPSAATAAAAPRSDRAPVSETRTYSVRTMYVPIREGALIPTRGPRIRIATPTAETVSAIRDALDARLPIALLHHKLAPDELRRERALVDAAMLPDDAAAILFTSGSTGAPRGVVLSRGALDAAAAASAAHLGWRADDRWLLALSTAHAGGLAVVVRCHAAGRPIELLAGDADRSALAAALARSTLASLVPTQLAMLLDDPGWRSPAGLRAVLLGGAAAPPAPLEEAARRGVPFLTTYGLTETFGQIATAPIERAGDPLAPLVPLQGVELAAGTPQAPAPIVVHAPMLATCYLDGTPIAPAFATADLGYLDGGALRVVGRADDVIITGGENVHPAQVEAILAATPGVRAACAFAVEDPRWGQIVGAAIAVSGPFDARAAAERWHAALPPHARPRRLATAPALPLLPGGKIDRRAAAALPAHAVDYH